MVLGPNVEHPLAKPDTNNAAATESERLMRFASSVINPLIRFKEALRGELAGPIETGDVLARDAALPELTPDDLLAIETAGAYGAVMSSSYNTRLPIAEIMVKDDKFCVIRPRPDYDALLSLDHIPEWLRH